MEARRLLTLVLGHQREVDAPREPDLTALQERAEAEGRACVVAGLIVNDRGAVFVHRRAWDRKLLPGLWDVPGGHVEPGETLLDALRREVSEETGWEVTGRPCLAYVSDWESMESTEPHRRREFDFLVDVSGDLTRPRLEKGKHVQYRWILPDGISIVDENRGRDEGIIRRLVELALRAHRSSGRSLPHISVFLPDSVGRSIEQLRRVWDPAMAGQVAAHLSIAYPDEVGRLDQLQERVSAAARRVEPFPLRLGRAIRYDQGSGIAVGVDVRDTGGLGQLREEIVSGAARSDFAPHVTIVRPRTTNRGVAAWQELHESRWDGEWIVTELAVTAFDGRVRSIEGTAPLGRG